MHRAGTPAGRWRRFARSAGQGWFCGGHRRYDVRPKENEMKRFMLCFAAILALAMVSPAQDTSAQTSGSAPKGGKATTKGPQKSAGAMEGDQDVRGVTGCVSKSGDNYMLTNAHYKKGFAVHGSDDLG